MFFPSVVSIVSLLYTLEILIMRCFREHPFYPYLFGFLHASCASCLFIHLCLMNSHLIMLMNRLLRPLDFFSSLSITCILCFDLLRKVYLRIFRIVVMFIFFLCLSVCFNVSIMSFNTDSCSITDSIFYSIVFWYVIWLILSFPSFYEILFLSAFVNVPFIF